MNSKTIIRIIFAYMLAFLFIPVQGQVSYRNSLSLPGELVQKGDSLYLTLRGDFANLDLGRNQALMLTPILVGSGRQVSFPPILINGKVRQKAYSRALALDDDTRYANSSYYAVLAADNGRYNQMNYRYAIPYQDWMETSTLNLRQDVLGCAGDNTGITIEGIITEVMLDRVPYNWVAMPAYIQPAVEQVKKRNDKFEAYLDFEVAKTNILPNFRNNQAELTKLENGFAGIRDDNNVSITHIDITGYASPEGSVALNDRLSQGRADALKQYMTSRVNLPSSVYQVQRGGEDWNKLEALVEASSLPAKQEILNIIRTTPDLTQRQDKITRLNGGSTYRVLLNDYYPQLRRVVCQVNYTVRDFTVEEAREIIRTRPQQLSLDEMYRVANTYPQGSPAYNEVFEIAVRLFPDDPVANMNAAATALSKGDTGAARRYLDRSNTNSAEYYNNLGLLYLQQENYGMARDSFNRAAQMGSQIGRTNLNELNKKIESEKIEIR